MSTTTTTIEPKAILVSGATGKQGGAVVEALLSLPDASSKYHIVALTRDINSSSAQRLVSKYGSSNLSLIQGTFDNSPAIFTSYAKPIWGVFSVQVPTMSFAAKPGQETREGNALIDASKAAGVKRFVYSSVDAGSRPETTAKGHLVPHFATKLAVEAHLRDSGMEWTVLSLPAFFDNLLPLGSFPSRVFTALWRDLKGGAPISFISTRDVGKFAALAFDGRYRNAAVTVAGDKLTMREADEIYREETKGESLPVSWWITAALIRWGVKEMGTMAEFWEVGGVEPDLQWNKGELRELEDFRAWLRRVNKLE